MSDIQTLDVSALFAGSSSDYERVCNQIVDVLSEECGFVAIGHPAMVEQLQRANYLVRFFDLSHDGNLLMARSQFVANTSYWY
ncbi:MAG: hypothetical protein MK000_09705, partial [Anaerolineales bacterium]|nr:hypothetical protein [Anaerolineales bacterium]